MPGPDPGKIAEIEDFSRVKKVFNLKQVVADICTRALVCGKLELSFEAAKLLSEMDRTF